MSLKIGIDATSWANGRGYGRYTRELLTAILELNSQHEIQLFIEASNESLLDHLRDQATIVAVPLSNAPTSAASADSSRSPIDMWRMRRAVSKANVDVFFFPTVYTWFPLARSQKVLLCIHDAIAERFPDLCFNNNRAKLFWNLKVKSAIKQADLFLTISKYAASDLVGVLGVPEEKIHIASNAPSKSFKPRQEQEVNKVAQSFGLTEGDEWFVYVGGFNPHKNLLQLVSALENHRRVGQHQSKLLLIGSCDQDVFHGEQAEIRDRVRDSNVASSVIWTGFVKDDDLSALLTGALALVLPSECEGFGLPAIEAAACGTPVIATSESPLPEILKGGGIFYEPHDKQSLVNALNLMADDPKSRSQMGQTARESALKLTWQNSAETALFALEEAAS